MTVPAAGSTFRVPHPALNVVLVEPQIPPNTGNIARLCAAARCHLILVGALGFDLDDAALRRAGLDYWEYVSWEHVAELGPWVDALPPERLHLLSARAETPYTRMPVQRGDWLLFGKETTGLPNSLLERFAPQCYTVPIAERGVRSLNLSSAVAVVVYDALRRIEGF